MNARGSILDTIGTDIMKRLDRLGEISESPNFLARRCYTPEHRQVNNIVAAWMRDAGMTVREDAMGNVIGRYDGTDPDAPAILLGSHIDTVIMAGKYDGPLGVVTAIDVVRDLNARQIRLRNPVEVAAFADEEGVRFQSTYLGSRAVAGTFDAATLNQTDQDGTTLAEAMTAFGLDPLRIGDAARTSGDILCYLEVHIEQGPVLEAEDLAVSAVTAIAGAERMTVTVTGHAGHAGTVPMDARQDALCAAAECILAVENTATTHLEAVGTVGQLTVEPGASNVIPGEARFSVDFRAPLDDVRRKAVAHLMNRFDQVAAKRNVTITREYTHGSDGVHCAKNVVDAIETAMSDLGHRPFHLPSGAGHDAAAMAAIAPVGMIFVRCEGGISHNPAEQITPEDAAAGAAVLLRTVEKLGGLNQ